MGLGCGAQGQTTLAAQQVTSTQFNSALPILTLDTAGRTIVNEPKTSARLGVISQPSAHLNTPTDPPNAYQGPIGIEVRGSSSQAFPKKSYLFETRNASGKALDVPLLGLPAGSRWVLNAAYADPSLLRDAVGYNLSRRMGRNASRTVPVEVMLNGQYLGVYLLEEKPEVAPGRITLGPDGVLLQLTPADRVKPGDISFKLPESGTVFIVEWPKGKNLSAAALLDIQRFTTAFAAQLYHPDTAAPGRSYLDYLDVDAMVDYMLLNEYLKNADALYASTYVTRDTSPGAQGGGKLVFGPVWDLDRGLGNSGTAALDAPAGWTFRTALFTEVLYDNPTFVRRFVARWQDLRRSGVIDSVLADLDRDARRLTDPASRNFARWPVEGTVVLPGTPTARRFPEEVERLRSWLILRAQWMDANISSLIQPGWPAP
ncbi:hypothetical protein GCM10010844_29190 [Deinococcus radiotolerans]|uniref:Spore coat protein CotH n=1 Tax=Deinococcus radiotolerans TaxID=1309407 RepID=A0ABQ2FLY5_9DEIO|nr:hypothetical protein GCM10010844_29190 [Deinococcus radiotolerans]